MSSVRPSASVGRPRLGPEPLSPSERQARCRTSQAVYVAALEAAVLDASVMSSISDWQARHAPTIRRAFAAYRASHPELDAFALSVFLPE